MKPIGVHNSTATLITLMIVVVLLEALALNLYKNQVESREWVLHTNAVLGKIQLFRTALTDAETGQRGFLLTGDEAYLSPFVSASNTQEKIFGELRSLTTDNPQQQRRLNLLSTSIQSKFAELRETINLRRTSGPEAALKVVKTDRGKQLMDTSILLLGAMEETEQKLLQQRMKICEKETTYTASTILLLLLLTMVAIVASLFIQRNRKRIEAEVEKQRNLLELIVETISDGLVVADHTGKFLVFNHAAKHILGIGSIEDPPDQWSASYGLFLPDKITPVPTSEVPLIRAMSGERVDNYEMFVRNKNNTEGCWISIAARPIRSPDKQFAGGLVTFRDVSEKKEAEKRVSEFYSVVSHELRTPLTSIRGSLGLMEGGLAGEISEKAARFVKIARTESDRLIRLINDILDIRKIEAGQMVLKKTNIDSANLTRQALENMQSLADEAKIKLKPEINTHALIECDVDRIVQVLTNFVSNAIKFSPAGSEVVVQIALTSSGNVRFSITDHGVGIPEEQKHKLFGMFQQIDSSDSRKVGGTGLGLAISKAIIEEHDGQLGVETKVGAGSTFWFELPTTAKPSTSKSKNKPEISEEGIAALLVEDDDSICEVLQAHLAEDKLDVIRAATVTEAEQMLKQFKPAVIILDLNLPDGDGLELFYKLNKNPQTAHIPVIIVTAKPSDSKLYSYPALIDWITKPIDESRLHRAIKLAQKQQFAQSQVLIVEDDSSTREVLKQQLSALNIKCLEATDGAEAITRARNENPDLIILDLGIPPPDGFAVVDILRKENNRQKPLIIYTVRDDLTKEQMADLSLGLTVYLNKTKTTQEQLLQTVRNLLNGILVEQETDKTVNKKDG